MVGVAIAVELGRIHALLAFFDKAKLRQGQEVEASIQVTADAETVRELARGLAVGSKR